MAFRDLPVIDPPSINSERSERALSVFLNQKTGFICRPDRPDKGCDFDVELIIDGRSAANHRFGVQVKSVEQLPLLADGVTISYAFETSRLGYLLNRPVGEGLIVLYDVSDDRLYYEYAVTLHNRLMHERESDDWLKQDSVNIHIPSCNVLQEAAATAIHDHFRDRFQRAAFIFASQGPRYGLTIAKPIDSSYDLNNPEDVCELLLKHGLGLLQDHELSLCFWLLQKLPLKDIETQPNLMVLAALAYGEMGRRYDSESFIRKLYKRDQVPEAQRLMIRFCHLKNQMILDQIDMAEFKAGAVDIRNEETNIKNILLLDLNIIFYELLSVKFYHGLPPDILARIRSIFDQILDSHFDSRSRQLIEVNNAENLAQYVNFVRLTFFNDLAIRRAAKAADGSLQLMQQWKELHALENELNDVLQRLYNDAKSCGDRLLQGQALLVRSRYLMAKEIDLYSQWPVLKNLRFHDQETYIHNIRLALSGRDHLMEVGYVELAYQSLYTGIELVHIGRHVYHYRDGIDLDDLLALKDKIESEHELESIDLQFPALIKRMASIRNEDRHYMSDTRDMDDQQLKGLALAISRAFGLPANCHPNLLNELNNCRLFYQRRNEDLELVPYDRNYDQRALYRTPVRFVIYNKRTNLRSLPSSDVSALLSSWGV